MFVERILCPIVTLGPGRRLIIWTKGCSKKCKGCISPEMASIEGTKEISVKDLFSIILNIYQTERFEGITISGGDPLEQLSELIMLLEKLREITDDILVYTGYVWEDFNRTISLEEREKLERSISVLIDGPYVQEKNSSDLSLRGSSNQNIIYFDWSKKETYEAYLKKGRQLQNVYIDNKFFSIGIMNR